MAKGRKTGGKDWVPGQSGNPRGRAKMPQDVKDFRKAFSYELVGVLDRLLTMKLEDLKEFLRKDRAAGLPAPTSLEAMVGGVIYRAASRGDQAAFSAILDRTIGPVNRRLQIFGDNDEDPIKSVPMTPEEAKQYAKAYLELVADDEETV